MERQFRKDKYHENPKRSWRSAGPQTATSLENKEDVKDMIWSQEDHHGTHVPPTNITQGLKILQSSVLSMMKRKGVKQFNVSKHLT